MSVRRLLALTALLATVFMGGSARGAAPVLERVEVVPGPPAGVRLWLSQPVEATSSMLAGTATASARIVVDLPGTQLAPGARGTMDGTGPVIRVRTGQFTESTARVVLDLDQKLPYALERDGVTVTIAVRSEAAQAAHRATGNETLTVLSPAAPAASSPEGHGAAKRTNSVPRLRKLYLDYPDLGRLLSPPRR